MPQYTRFPALYGLTAHQLSLLSPDWVVDADEKFLPGSLRTRLRVLGANGPITLTIPVKKHPKGTPTSQVKIDYIQKWQNQHWRTLQSAYGKSPYFEYYEAELQFLFSQKPDNLPDFTIPILRWLHSQFFPKGNFCDNVTQILVELQPVNIQNLSIAEVENGTGLTHSYPQVFGQEFVPRLSVLDFLFCCGPNFAIPKTE